MSRMIGTLSLALSREKFYDSLLMALIEKSRWPADDAFDLLERIKAKEVGAGI